ncbi:MAG: radical SAM protein [Gemmiger sp.]
MNFVSYAERMFLRRHLSRVRHITLDPGGPGVVRIHLIPARKVSRSIPFLAILNGQELLPLQVSWAILLTNLIEALLPYEGREISEADWTEVSRRTVSATARVYRTTPALQIDADLQLLLQSLEAVARGETPPVSVQPMRLGDYAPHMTAPHRMDLMISAMMQNGTWHCNQKCLHCYAARQPMAEVPELATDQWLGIIEKCRAAGVAQLTFTGGEPTLRHDLVELVRAARWFVTRLNTNGRMLTSHLCQELADASLDSVQITLYAADEATHNTLVGATGFTDTVNGIRNALAAGLNVSLNTPLCSLNRDYRGTVAFAHALGVRYLSCSGLIPTGGAACEPSLATRLSPEELTDILRPAMEYAAEHGIEISFTSPGWLPEDTLRRLGFSQIPSCGACLSNMAVAPDGTVLPCQSWLGGPGLGNLLQKPWPAIWAGTECRAIRDVSAQMLQRCQLGATPLQEESQ